MMRSIRYFRRQLTQFIHFLAFPDAVAESEIDKSDQVMFRTGGIRCEKASAVMMQQGWSDVRQLEEVYRLLKRSAETIEMEIVSYLMKVAVDPALEETTTQMCWACREPLTEEEMQSEQYVVTKSCPY